MLITKDIPNIIQTHFDNISYKLYFHIGEYKINHFYSLNDFLENSKHNHLYRITVLNEKRYLIITDISFLLFSICKETAALLLYINDITNFVHFEHIYEKDNIISKRIKWLKQYSNHNIYNEAVFHFSTSDFEKVDIVIKANKQKLKEQFKKIINIQEPIASTIEIIKYKEDLLSLYKNDNTKSKQSNNLLDDLIVLYQKVIEMLSIKGDSRYMEYVNKLKTLLEK